MAMDKKQCGESCGCATQNRGNEEEKNQEQLNQNPEKNLVTKTPEKEADPTRFGDWEIGGRAIDF